jgi:hypothetical protein
MGTAPASPRPRAIACFKPWALDFAPNNYGEEAFPKFIHPRADKLAWGPDDWDRTLRSWTLGFDPLLGEWLRHQDSSQRSIIAAREFATQHAKWRFTEQQLLVRGWLQQNVHLKWRYGKSAGPDAPATTALAEIGFEIDHLFELMEDDRDRYLAEIDAQADRLPAYMIHFLGIDAERRPHTMDLIRCGLAIGNLFYFNYKALFNRVRPSAICPGLVPPFGPPRHPAFPSGHSFAGHFLALLLLEIDQITALHGERPNGDTVGAKPELKDVMSETHVFSGPLLWLADRMATNRERAGLHYHSDSLASRWLAGALWKLLTIDASSPLADATPPDVAEITADDLISCPTLRRVLAMSKAEWA